MAKVPEVVRDIYAEIPRDCFVAGVPFTLLDFGDNEVIPSFGTVTGPDGVEAKWIRFCDFLPFVDACKSYWMESGDNEFFPSEALKEMDPLYIHVMPYTPLRDAFYLHELIVNADNLPQYASVVTMDHAVQPVDFAQENVAAEPRSKHGILEVAEGHFLNFVVFNYNLLWCKAQKFCILSYVRAPLDECLHRLEVCTNLLHGTTSRDTTQQLVSAVDDARRRLALALMEKYAAGIIGVDPHDALLAMYPDVHDAVYQDLCQQCYPESNTGDQESPLSRIGPAMQGLGYEDLLMDDQLSIHQAEYSLLSAEGAADFHNYNTRARASFFASKDMITKAMNPTFDHWSEATTSHCLMGVPACFEDANPDEAN